MMVFKMIWFMAYFFFFFFMLNMELLVPLMELLGIGCMAQTAACTHPKLLRYILEKLYSVFWREMRCLKLQMTRVRCSDSQIPSLLNLDLEDFEWSHLGRKWFLEVLGTWDPWGEVQGRPGKQVHWRKRSLRRNFIPLCLQFLSGK